MSNVASKSRIVFSTPEVPDSFTLHLLTRSEFEGVDKELQGYFKILSPS